MNIINNYLNNLQEQYSPSIAKTEINGEFQENWTNCYNSKCVRGEEDKFARNYCKTECQMTAANKAITRLNSELSNCGNTREPKRCIDSIRSAIESYRDKISKAREMQDKISSRESAFKRKVSGG